MSKVIIYTSAYNAERTLCRTVESVLTQTYTDFTYYLLDNASTDRTGEIIEEFKALDSRIIPLRNEKNCHGNSFMDVIKDPKHGDDSYFCELDADDEYTPGFMEKMIAFVTENNLDTATCGSDWIDEKTGQIIKHKVAEENILLEGQEFAERFPEYRNFMVTLWGGLYKISLLRKCNFDWDYTLNFSDTAFCMDAFRYAKRAGVFGECLHKYYISSGTDSYKYNPKWFWACKNLIEHTREYLLDYGEISRKNEDYLYVILLMLIKYILPRIRNADVALSEKLNCLHEIFNDEMTQYMLSHWTEAGIYSDKGEFLGGIKNWIIAQEGCETDRAITERLISFMNI